MYLPIILLLSLLSGPAWAGSISGDPTRVSKTGDTMRGTLVLTAGATLQVQAPLSPSDYSLSLGSGARLEAGGLSFPDGTTQYTSAQPFDPTAIGIATAALAASTGALSASTVSLQAQLVSVGVSTAALAVSTGALSTSTGSLQAQLVSVGASTAGLQAQLVSVGISTAALAVSTGALSTSTESLQAQLVSVGVSTAALAVSTGALSASTVSLAAQFATRASSGINADITTLKSLTSMTAASVQNQGLFSVKCAIAQNVASNLAIGPQCNKAPVSSSFSNILMMASTAASSGNINAIEFYTGVGSGSDNILGRLVGISRGFGVLTGVEVSGIDLRTGSIDSVGAVVFRAGLASAPEVGRFDSAGFFGVGTGSTITDQIQSAGTIRAGTYFNSGAGSASLPAYNFTADSNTGLYNVGADRLGLATKGNLALEITALANGSFTYGVTAGTGTFTAGLSSPGVSTFGTGAVTSTFTASGYWFPAQPASASGLCTTPGVTGAVIQDSTNYDLWTGTGTAPGSWRMVRTGAGPC